MSAKADIILFADADAIVDAEAIQKIADSFKDQNVVAVHPLLIPLTNNLFVRGSYRLMDQYFRFARWCGVVQGIGSVIAVRRLDFFKANGFKETLTVGEDADFLRRISYLGDVFYDRKNIVSVSARRFNLENKFTFATKCMAWAALRFFGSEKCPWGYKWSQYPVSLAHAELIFRKGSK